MEDARFDCDAWDGTEPEAQSETEEVGEVISLYEFVEDLKRKGYSVKYNSKIKGESGHVHHVDGLARRGDNGKAIIWLEKHIDTITEIIQTFAIAYDTGAEPCYAVDGDLGEEERRLAEFYKMKLLSK